MTVQSNWWFSAVNANNVNRPSTGYYAFFVADGTTYTGDGGSTATVTGTLYKMTSAGTITAMVPGAYTDEQAQDAVGNILVDSGTVDFTYDDAGNTITAIVKASSIANSMLATMTAHTVKANITGGTANPTDASLTAFVDDMVANGGLVEGLAGWIDVTRHPTNPVSPGNSSATNVTNLNAILSGAATGTTIYFPGGTYGFNAKITVPAKVFTFQGQGSNLTGGYTLLQWTSVIGDNLMQLTAGNWYSTFRNLVFCSSVIQTAGAALAVGDNVATNIIDCAFTGMSSSATLFNGIDFTGTGSGEDTSVTNVIVSSFTGVGINISGALTSPMLDNVVIQGIWGTTTQAATAGVQIQNAGAVQIVNSDIIGCVNNLLINPTTAIVVASVYVVNTYFDNSLGSCVKITGAGATVRCRFIACSMTTSSAGANGYSAVEISTTVTAGAQGIDFENCSVLNTFATTGTTNGFLITGAADFTIANCRIAGWTNGIQVTPFNSNGKTAPVIDGNTIGPTGGYGANAVGILLNAGAFQYGAILIQSNQLVGNTTPMTDNSTIAATTSKLILANGGLAAGPPAFVAGQAITATTVAAGVVAGAGVPLPVGSMRPGTTIRITAHCTNTATLQVPSAVARFGVNNTNADTIVANTSSFPFGTGSAVAGAAKIVAELTILTSTTAMASVACFNHATATGGVATTGFTNLPVQVYSATAPVTIATTAASWFGLYITASVASIVTVRSVAFEVISQ